MDNKAQQRTRVWVDNPPRPSARLELALILAIVGLAGIQGYRMLRTNEAPVSYEAGRLVAAGDLEDALYDPAKGRHEGGFSVANVNLACRSFTDGKVSGLACQRDGDWRIEELRQPETRQP